MATFWDQRWMGPRPCSLGSQRDAIRYMQLNKSVRLNLAISQQNLRIERHFKHTTSSRGADWKSGILPARWGRNSRFNITCCWPTDLTNGRKRNDKKCLLFVPALLKEERASSSGNLLRTESRMVYFGFHSLASLASSWCPLATRLDRSGTSLAGPAAMLISRNTRKKPNNNCETQCRDRTQARLIEWCLVQ